MDIYSLEDFKVEFEKLIRKNSYKSLESELFDCFFDKEIGELCNGTNLNNNNSTPYIKKRISGRGGFRCYYLAVIKDNSIYLMYIHPKTGPYGTTNIKPEYKSELYKKVHTCIKNGDLYKVGFDPAHRKISFQPSPLQ